ncbi:MAG: hypothetical protein ABWY06_21510 [Pseudomonas sp.]|uniref:hypothetical protein n=1 Tax=Pseudomonas sp. TaxID=306 RepID=UPI003393625A
MQIQLSPITTYQGHRWQVSLDRHCVSFRSEAEARAFIATLQARLQAPHHLPHERQSEAG